MIQINGQMKSSAAALAFFLSALAWAPAAEIAEPPAVSLDSPSGAGSEIQVPVSAGSAEKPAA